MYNLAITGAKLVSNLAKYAIKQQIDRDCESFLRRLAKIARDKSNERTCRKQ